MEKIKLEGLEETVYHEILDNGLNIYVLRKKEYNTYSCYFIANFGALVDNFVPINENEKHKFPKGVAHFLEHKLFEQETGPSVLEKFSSLGSTCNAFTNYDYTVYYVTGVDQLKENLTFLIDYVQSPFFTDENVEKEKGIINQERLMTLDNPYRTFHMKILDNIFVNYDYGKSIVGEKKDIYNITKEDLFRCYNTFYNPSNMSLIVVSNEDENEIIQIIRENQKHKKFDKQDYIEIEKIIEPDRINKKYDVIYDNVTKPEVSYSIKINLKKFDFDIDKVQLYLKILLITNFSKISDFNLELKNKQIINNNLEFSCSRYKDFGIMYITASTDKEKDFLNEIKNKYKKLDLSEEMFDLIKKNMISEYVYNFTSTDSIMNFLYNDYYENQKITSDGFMKCKQINYKEYIEIIKKIDYSNISITIMRPNIDKE